MLEILYPWGYGWRTGFTRDINKEFTMCSPVKCRQCGKTTWAGCGNHVEAVKRSVPAGQWCGGHQNTQTPSSGGGIFGRLMGR